MSSTTITTIVKMLENLPEPTQYQVMEHIREYIAEIQDEVQWDTSFRESQKQLITLAKRAKKEIANGHAVPMDHKQL
jgi:hypothetical protein